MGYSGFGFISDARRAPRSQSASILLRWTIAPLVFIQFVFYVHSSRAQERVRIAPSSPGLAAWLMHLGAKEGLFAREGLSPEIIVMRTNTGIAALVTGSVDFTTAGGSAMRAAVNGAPVKMILNVNKKADLWIVAQKNIQRIEDLRGKMIGVGGNWGTQFYQVLEALRPSGVDKDVQLVSTGDVANGFLSLQQGSMHAGCSFDATLQHSRQATGLSGFASYRRRDRCVTDDGACDDEGQTRARTAKNSPRDSRGDARR